MKRMLASMALLVAFVPLAVAQTRSDSSPSASGVVLEMGYLSQESVRTELKLTPEQSTKIEEIRRTASFRTPGDASERDAAASEFEKRAAEARAQIDTVLSAEQNAKVKDLLGPAFTGQIQRFGAFQSATTASRGGGRGADSRGVSTALRSAHVQLGSVAGPSIALLKNTQTQRELKLPDEQVRKVNALPTVSRDDPAPAFDFLTPEQSQRLCQLTIQYGTQRYGPLGALHHAAAMESLALSTEQKKSIEAIAEADRTAIAALGAQAAREKIQVVDQETEAMLNAVLTEQQQARLKQLLGAKFAGTLSTGPAFGSGGRGVSSREGRGGFTLSVGSVTPDPWPYLTEASVQADLKLTDEQKAKIPALPQRFGGAPEEIQKILTPEQTTRLWQIQLQYLQKRSGLTYLFRYRDVVETLQLTDHQRETIQTQLRSTTAGFNAATNPVADKQVEALLTPEQKDLLKKTLGEPFDGEIRGSTTTRGAPTR